MRMDLQKRRGSSRLYGAIVGALALAVTTSLAGIASAASDYGAEWDKILELAKKEGSVSVALGSSATRETRPVWREFEKQVGIRVVLSGGSGSKVRQRILAEKRAGRVEVDVVGVGTGSMLTVLLPNKVFQPVEPLLFLPEVVDKKNYWGDKLWFGDPEEKYLILYNLAPGDAGIGINTKLVNEADISSYWDVLKSEYDGKRVSGTMDVSQGANTLAEVMALAGPEWLKGWVKAKPIIVQDTDIGVNYLVEGKVAIGMFLSGELDQLDELATQGAPVKRLIKPMKEGQLAGSGNCCFGLMANSPHPNAQKILINWLMSKEGQKIMQKVIPNNNSPRTDIPKDELQPHEKRHKDVKYIVLSQRKDYADLIKQGIAIVEKTQAEMKK